MITRVLEIGPGAEQHVTVSFFMIFRPKGSIRHFVVDMLSTLRTLCLMAD